jgi:hypothetical protein
VRRPDLAQIEPHGTPKYSNFAIYELAIWRV